MKKMKNKKAQSESVMSNEMMYIFLAIVAVLLGIGLWVLLKKLGASN